MLTRLKPSCA
jgi:hypothetical protein